MSVPASRVQVETTLAAHIATRIRAEGPISVAEYMRLALTHPEHGYYATRDPLGAAGDFTTAPEINQMFGELIGLWLGHQNTGLEGDAILAELGPGRGTLMADALRAAPSLADLPLWLVEVSAPLRDAQVTRFPDASWAGRLEELPDGPLLLIANEFLDALPVHQYLADGTSWREVQIGLDAAGGLTFGLSGPLPVGHAGPPDRGAWAERSPGVDAVIDEIARRIARFGGAALFIDYGYTAADRPTGSTLQAVRGHKRADPLAAPGEADLTWLLDFDALADRARTTAGIAARVTCQGAFLVGMGIGGRAQVLAQAQPSDADAIADALERLTMAGAMGERFKALAIYPEGQARPPGFDPATPVPSRMSENRRPGP